MTVTFGIQAAPTSWEPESDQRMYDEVLEDCRLAHRLGYHAVWMLEHHFSDYYPTPSPLLFLSHVAAECPGLGLGTCVLVLPWYHPLRVAEEIAMLNTLAKGELHLGLGRGTAKSEYDAYNVPMPEARARFAEAVEIIRLGLTGEAFTYSGPTLKIDRPIRVRPGPNGKPVHLYGAIGSAQSGELMGQMGLPPLCLAQFPDKLLARILENWRAGAVAAGRPTGGFRFPISVKVLVAETEAEATRLARKYYPRNFAVQARHYEVDTTPWGDIPGYEHFAKMFANLKAMADPDAIGPFCQMNLVGTPDRVAGRLQELVDIGFDYFAISASTPGADAPFRRAMITAFAEQVAPRFDPGFGGKRQAAE